MCDDAELGMFSTMTTITHSDQSPEMLAAIRRGPLAMPTEDEMIEYLLPAKKKIARESFEDYAYEHVVSYQHRVQAVKQVCWP